MSTNLTDGGATVRMDAVRKSPSATYRFYAELNDFLPSAKQGVAFSERFEGRRSVKDAIEALGAPHTEIDLVLVHGESVDFTYLLRDGDRVSVFPVFESLDVSSVTRVRRRPLREPRFVLDSHLGRLAKYLRMLGFDAVYQNNLHDEKLAAISSGDQRILLTRDRGLLKRRMVTHGYCVRQHQPELQVVEVLRRFDLFHLISPLGRCLRCNGLLEPVLKEVISHRLQPNTLLYYERFWVCPACDRIYWQGSHFRRMRQFIECVRSQAVAP